MSRKDLPAAVVLLALVLLLWAPVLARPGTIAFGLDLVQFFYWEHYGRAELADGALPLWNPYVYCGTPFLANPQTRLLYPPAVAFRLLPIEFSFSWSLALHMWWAGLAMYALMRDWGSCRWGALFSSLAFMLGGFLVPRLYGGHVDIIQGVCWTPLALLCTARAMRGGRLLPVLGAGAALAMQFLSGFVPLVLYSGLLLLGYAGWWIAGKARAPDWKRIAVTCLLRFGVLAGVALALAAIQLLPTLELAAWSNRAGGLPLETADLGSLEWRHLVTLFAPHLYYDPVNQLPFPDELIWERCPYVGLLPLLLAPLALVSGRRSAWFWGVVALGGLATAVGMQLPFYPVLWRLIPFFRIPGQFLLLWCLGTAALAGLAIDALVEHPGRVGRWLKLIGAVLASLAAVTALLWVVDGAAFLAADGRAEALVDYNLRTTAVRALLSALAAFAASRARGQVGGGALAAALMIDLWLFGRHYVVPVRADSLLMVNAEVFEVVRAGPAESRWAPVTLDYTVGTATLLGNQSMAAKAPSAGGYAPLFLKHYADLVAVSSGMDPTAVAPFADFPQFGTVRPWVLDLLNVRYIVTSADCPSDTVLLDRELRVCDNPQAMERALWVGQAVSRVEGVDSLEYLCGESFDPAYEVLLPNGGATESVTSRAAGDVRIVEYKPHGVVLDVSAPVDGWVVIADAYYPGWQAWVSGEETPVLRADWALRAVSVPAGESRIVLQYRSILFEAGAWISGVSFATVVVLVIRYLTRSRSAIAGAEWAAGDA